MICAKCGSCGGISSFSFTMWLCNKDKYKGHPKQSSRPLPSDQREEVRVPLFRVEVEGLVMAGPHYWATLHWAGPVKWLWIIQPPSAGVWTLQLSLISVFTVQYKYSGVGGSRHGGRMFLQEWLEEVAKVKVTNLLWQSSQWEKQL